MLGDLSSMDSVQNAAEVMCASDACGNRLSNYADYLYTCRVGNLGNNAVCYRKISRKLCY